MSDCRPVYLQGSCGTYVATLAGIPQAVALRAAERATWLEGRDSGCQQLPAAEQGQWELGNQQGQGQEQFGQGQGLWEQRQEQGQQLPAEVHAALDVLRMMRAGRGEGEEERIRWLWGVYGEYEKVKQIAW